MDRQDRVYNADWFPGCNSTVNAMIAPGILAAARIYRRPLRSKKGRFGKDRRWLCFVSFRGSDGLTAIYL